MNVILVFKEQHQAHIHADWVWAGGSLAPARLLRGL